jgi:hypothetical protein
MENIEFLEYFNTDKETIKLLLAETQVRLEEMAEVLNLDPDDQDLNKDYDRECERFRALKLALTAVDSNACLSTVDFDGTLNINKVYGKIKKTFNFDFS